MDRADITDKDLLVDRPTTRRVAVLDLNPRTGDLVPGRRLRTAGGTRWIPTVDVNQFLADVLDAEEPRWSSSGKQFFRYVAFLEPGAPGPV